MTLMGGARLPGDMLAAVSFETPPAEETFQSVPVELGDNANGRKAAQENLEQHAPTSRIEISADRHLGREQSDQHEKGDRQPTRCPHMSSHELQRNRTVASVTAKRSNRSPGGEGGVANRATGGCCLITGSRVLRCTRF